MIEVLGWLETSVAGQGCIEINVASPTPRPSRRHARLLPVVSIFPGELHSIAEIDFDAHERPIRDTNRL